MNGENQTFSLKETVPKQSLRLPRLSLAVPSRSYEKLRPFVKEDFQAEITEDDTQIALTYT